MLNSKNKAQKFAAAVIVLIILIAVFFHYPITIVNALTLDSLPEFGIHIPVWRVVFEPFLGILLFFNQSFYTIPEMVMLLIWILAIYLIYSIIKFLLFRESSLRKSFVLRQLVHLPIVIGIWFALFVLIIFIPLPNNTIVNNSPNTVLVTTHSHTDYSHDGLITEADLWQWHRRNGFDAFFITDHNNHNKTLEFVKAQRAHAFPGEPMVMAGEEYSGTNHLSLLGLKHVFKTKGFTDSLAILNTRIDSGAVLVNHWFDGEHKSLEYYRNLGVDGFEIENTATDKRYDRSVYQKIKDFCNNNQLIMNGGLDFHGYGSACSLWNGFVIPGWRSMDPQAKEASILKIIKTRDQNKLKVLLYNDRAYYNNKHLGLTPPITLFNYFRTLTIFQVLSWICWIFIFMLIANRLSNNKELTERLSCRRLVPILGFLSATFILNLGLLYSGRNRVEEDFTTMYSEYSQLLLTVGIVFVVYSCLVIGYRIFMRKSSLKTNDIG